MKREQVMKILIDNFGRSELNSNLQKVADEIMNLNEPKKRKGEPLEREFDNAYNHDRFGYLRS